MLERRLIDLRSEIAGEAGHRQAALAMQAAEVGIRPHRSGENTAGPVRTGEIISRARGFTGDRPIRSPSATERGQICPVTS